MIAKRVLPKSLYGMRDEFLVPFDKLMTDIFNDSFPDFGKELGVTFFEKGSYPKCDVINLTDKLQFIFEIPGIDKENISIEIIPESNGSNILSISGKKSDTTDDYKNSDFIRRELKHSSFKRSFILSNTLNIDNINAEFKNGILTIDIKKLDPEINKDNNIKKIGIK